MPQWGRCCQCSFWLKYMLYTINFLVCSGSIAAFVVGICAWFDNEQKGMLGHLSTLPALLLAAVGIVGSTVGLIGCLAAARESLLLLKLFCVAASLLFLCEIIGGTLMFTLMDHVRSVFKAHLLDAIVGYQRNEQFQDLIDYIQQKLECCGATDFRDWDSNVYFSCSVSMSMSMSSKLQCTVPMSCCSVRGDLSCGVRLSPYGELSIDSMVFSRGCTEPLLLAFKSGLFHISILAFAIGISEVVSVILANALMRCILQSSIAELRNGDSPVQTDGIRSSLTSPENDNETKLEYSVTV